MENSIFVAIISPPVEGILEISLKGDIGMIIAPLVNTNDKYEKFWKICKKYKILDNGAFEKRRVKIKNLIDIALRIKANEIILPDEPLDSSQTIKLTHRALYYIEKKGFNELFKIHVVPHGQDKEDYLNCLNEFLKDDTIDVIGLSKISIPVCFGRDVSYHASVFVGRLRAIRLLKRMYKVEERYIVYNNKKFEVHLLGGHPLVAHEIYFIKNILKAPFVRSVDTELPVVYGILKIKFDEDTLIPETIVPEYPNILELTNNPKYANIQQEAIEIAHHNVDILLRVARRRINQ